MISTPVIFGKNEFVHIISPDFFDLPKQNLPTPSDGSRVMAGYFVGSDSALLTLTDTNKTAFLVNIDTHDADLPGTPAKPGGAMTGYRGNMEIRTRVFEESGTAFVTTDRVSIAAGKIVHVDATNTIDIGEVVGRGSDYITVSLAL